jgi:hypothetical protein
MDETFSADGAGAEPALQMADHSAATQGMADLLGEFFSELMGYRSVYGLDRLGELMTPAEAEAIIRLRLRIAEQFLSRGWSAPDAELASLQNDRALLEERDDEAALLLPLGEALSGQPQHTPDGQAPRDDKPDSPTPAEVELNQLREAMASRAVIEQAKGIAMERYGLPATTAWSWLVRTSQQRNEKLRQLAQQLVDSVAGAPSDGSASDSKTSS